MANPTTIPKSENRLDVHDRLLQALDAHLRELPNLSALDSTGHFVEAYHGRKRVALTTSENEAFLVCDRLGLPREEIAIVIVSPPDEEEEVEDCLGLYEFDEIEDDVELSSEPTQHS